MKSPIIFLFVFLLINILPIFGQKPNHLNTIENQNNIQGIPFRTNFNINNISTWVYSNGDMDVKPDGNTGFEYPKGSGKAAIYESGFVWGGKINDKIHVGGSTYAQGLLPGRILENGTPQDPEEESARIYRVRPDFSYADLSSEIRDENISYNEVLNNYQKDWDEWPADWGAPYNDIDQNGNYNPSIDIPGVPGAHQTIWYVANDFDTATCRSLYGSDPMKVEFQVTIWGYNIPQTLYDNVIFKKYKLINKNNVDIEPLYISQWADIDLGDAGDDFIGCDSLLNLMYSYNGDDYDATYGEIIPAVGFQLLQGPKIHGEQTDTAIYNNSYWPGYKNVNMKSHYYFIGGDPVYDNPNYGEYVTGTLYYYNLFMGKVAGTGNPFIDPVTKNENKFVLSGNPITGEGWIDGIIHPPGSRRNGFVTGPFNLAVGDTQEVVIAQYAAMGTDRLNSLLLLKEYGSKLQKDYPNNSEHSYSSLFRKIGRIKPSIKQNFYTEYNVIELNIDRQDTIESFSEENFEFQGYNIYQFKQESDFSRTGINLFTFDKIDNISTIFGDKYDPVLGTLTNDALYSGTNSGFPKKIIIDKDYILNSKLIKGKTYYYGIIAYLYNEQENRTIETPPRLIEVIYQEDLPGAKYSDVIETNIINGNSDAEFTIEIVDPEKLTGDTYEITFAEQHYYLDKDGEWKKTNYPDSIGKSLSKPKDQTLSRIIPMQSIYAQNSTIDLHFMVKNNAPDYNYIDAISITFPEGIIINDANDIYSNHTAFSVIDGQTVTWGEHEVLSADGPFYGGEDLVVNINGGIEPTFTVDYIIYDDGWSEAYAETDSQYYNLGAGTVDGYGSVTLTGEVGYHFKTIPYWRLTDKTTNEVKLEEIEIVESGYWYLRGDKYGEELILDGFKIKLEGGSNAPTTFRSTEFTVDADSSDGDLTLWGDLQLFGGVTGFWFEEGSTSTIPSIEASQPDLQFRFTGVAENNDAVVTSGGQWTTQWERGAFGANDMTGLNSVQIRVPFEVWDIENNIQLEVVTINRNADGASPYDNDVGDVGDARWRITGRDYIVILYKEYVDDANLVRNLNDETATWCLFFTQGGSSVWSQGDVFSITYANPIEFSDVYTFTTPEAPTDKIFPNKYSLFQNYPNPFNPKTKIRYFIPEEGNVKISVFNILGQKVTEVLNKNVKAGKYETEFNGSNLASGVYIYRIEVDSPTKANIYSQTKKMLLLK